MKYTSSVLAFLLFTSVCGLLLSSKPKTKAQNEDDSKPTIAFTFDDGSINDFGQYK